MTSEKGYLNSEKVFLALYQGRIDQLENALRRGFSLDSTNEDDQTLLQEASMVGSAEAVALLLKAGVPVDQRNPDGDTPLILAILSPGVATATKAPQVDLADLPLADRVRWAAAGGKSEEVVASLIAAGADPNGRGSDGWTPLLHAINEGRADVVGMLLDAGADATLHAEDRITPIALAQRRRRRNPEIVSLIQHRLPTQMGLDLATTDEPARRARAMP